MSATSIVKGKLIRRTDKATLMLQNGLSFWIPDSVIPYRKIENETELTLKVEDWFLAKHPEILAVD